MALEPTVAYLTLYRGQPRDYGVVLPSGWRAFWRARQASLPQLSGLAERYFAGALDDGALEAGIDAIAAGADKERPTLHRFLKEAEGRALLAGLIRDIRVTFAEPWRNGIFRAQLGEIETALFLRYQTFLFNGVPDAFIAQMIGEPLHRLAQELFVFYDARRAAFSVENRIGQVAADFMGVLQHYGALDTPGLDLTSDLDIALWFATHRYDRGRKAYGPLPPGEWGYVYSARVPIVTWSRDAGEPIAQWPETQTVCLADLSPSLTRIARQKGYYAIHRLSWDRIIDYRVVFAMDMTRALDHGSAAEIGRRLRDGGLTERFLFPPPEDDAFRKQLGDRGIRTFL